MRHPLNVAQVFATALPFAMTEDGQILDEEIPNLQLGNPEIVTVHGDAVLVDHQTLKYHLLGPSLTKAGQDSVDQQKVR